MFKLFSRRYQMPFWLYNMLESSFKKVNSEQELKEKIQDFIKLDDKSKQLQIVEKKSRSIVQVFFNGQTQKWDTRFKLRK